MFRKFSPEKLVSEIKEMGDKGDWFIFEDSRSQINQDFASRKDLAGLVEFYRNALELVLDESDLVRLHELQGDLDQLKPMFKQLLRETITNAESKENVVSLYLEYGDEASIFLCSAFDEGDDDWACNVVEESEQILLDQLGKIYDWGIDTFKEELFRRYVDASLLSYFLEPVFAMPETIYKFGFAEHDFKIVTVPRYEAFTQ